MSNLQVPLSPRANSLKSRVAKRYLESLENNVEDSIQYGNITGAAGILVRTGLSSVAARLVEGTANRITIANGGGLLGNIGVDLASTYVGQTSITTLGTITTGNVSKADVTGLVTSSSTRDLDNKLFEIFSVKDYGAVADGNTDDAPAINAAIAAASAYATHGIKIYLPPGVYAIGSVINMPVDTAVGIQFCGAGRAKTMLTRKASYTSGDIIFADDIANDIGSVCDIRDLMIVNANGVHVTDGYGIHIKDRSWVTIKDVLIYEGYGAIHVEASAVVLDNVNFESSGTYAALGTSKAGLYLSGFGCAVDMVNCNFNGVATTSANELQAGLWIEGCDNLKASNCSFSGIYGVYFKGVGSNIDNCFFSNCLLDACREKAIVFEGVNAPAVYTNIRFSSCHINVRVDSGLDTQNIYFDSACDVDYVSFICCNINEAGATAINILSTTSYVGGTQKSLQFIGCEISYNNRLNNAAYPAINVATGASGVMILGNTIQNRNGAPIDHQAYAITLNGSNTNCSIVGNRLSPNILGGINYVDSGYTNLRVYGNIGATDIMGADASIPTPYITTGLKDANGNSILALPPATSPANYLAIANSAPTENPLIAATGSDINVGIDFRSQVAGTFRFFGNTSALTSWHSDTGAIIHNVSAASTDRTVTWPDSSGTIVYSTGTVANATNTAITNDTTTNATMYPTWVTATSGNLPQKVSSTKLTFNPSTASLSTTTFIGALSGNASTATALATSRAIYGNNFDGSTALTQVIASTYGGTGNGFAKFTGPTSSEKTFTLPDSSVTLLYSGGALGTPASGTLSSCTGYTEANLSTSDITTNNASTSKHGFLKKLDNDATHFMDGQGNWSAVSAPTAASQSDQETGTSTTVYVSPGRQQYHQSAAKFWSKFDGTGTPSSITSYNLSSITDNGVGDYTLNFTVSFSSANYCSVGGQQIQTGALYSNVGFASSSTGSINVQCINIDPVNAKSDSTQICVACFGDQ